MFLVVNATACGKTTPAADPTPEASASPSPSPSASPSPAVAATVTFSGTITVPALTAMRLHQTLRLDDSIEQAWRVTASTAADFKVVCATLETTSTAAEGTLGADGKFSVTVPADKPFSCYLDSIDATADAAALIKVEDSTLTALSGDTIPTSSIALKSNAVLADTLTPDSTNTIKIPVAKVTASLSSSLATIAAADLHDKYFRVTCIDTGNAKDLKRCRQKFTCDWSVTNGQPKTYAVNYMRVFNETESSNTVQLLGIWKGATSFSKCGSIDMGPKLRTAYGLATNGATDWSFDDSGCTHRMYDEYFGHGDGDSTGPNSNRYANEDFSLDTTPNWKRPGNLTFVEKVAVGADGSWNLVQHNRIRMGNTHCGYDTIIYANLSKSADSTYDFLGIYDATAAGGGTPACAVSGVDHFTIGYKAITQSEAQADIPNDGTASCMSLFP